VHGIGCLRPGLSETVRVVSVVGRLLEHSRIFWFENGGEPEALIGSADLMRRNLDRRIETLVPVLRPELVRHLCDGILRPYLEDTVNAWELGADGCYRRRTPPVGATPFCAQDWLVAHPSTATLGLVQRRD
jgi:polyphosphate kinase